MKISARNQLSGVVTSVKEGVVTAEVIVKISSGEEIVSVVTLESVHALEIKPGSTVKAIIKATEVMLATNA